MFSFYIENFINDSTKDCNCTYNFGRMGIRYLKEIFQDVWKIGKVNDIDYITTQSTETQYGAIVYIEEDDIFNNSRYIMDLLEYNECSKRKFYIYGDIENSSGPYLEVELCTSDMLYAMSSKHNY
jgi:hypothetical protein